MDSYAESDLQLSAYALFGLAYSGHSRAGVALRALQESPTPEQVRFRNAQQSTIAQWIEVFELVDELGLEGMFEYYETQ